MKPWNTGNTAGRIGDWVTAAVVSPLNRRSVSIFKKSAEKQGIAIVDQVALLRQ
jgi:hypothetical protein